MMKLVLPYFCTQLTAYQTNVFFDLVYKLYLTAHFEPNIL